MIVPRGPPTVAELMPVALRLCVGPGRLCWQRSWQRWQRRLTNRRSKTPLPTSRHVSSLDWEWSGRPTWGMLLQQQNICNVWHVATSEICDRVNKSFLHITKQVRYILSYYLAFLIDILAFTLLHKNTLHLKTNAC